jgi:hypothetical protein
VDAATPDNDPSDAPTRRYSSNVNRGYSNFTIRSGSCTGSGRRKAASITLNSVEFTPMPTASDTTASADVPGARANCRRPCRRSRTEFSSQSQPRCSRQRSCTCATPPNCRSAA